MAYIVAYDLWKNSFVICASDSMFILHKFNPAQLIKRFILTDSTTDTAPMQICCCSPSSDGRYFAVATNRKFCHLFTITPDDDWSLHRIFPLPKAPTAIEFDCINQYVIVADRAGSVTRYPIDKAQLSEQTTNIAASTTDDDDAETAKRFGGEILLGHLSIILDVKLVGRTDRFVITCDRDEKIRISRYPQSFVIRSFALGHAQYVRNLSIWSNDDDDWILSSSGDGALMLWNLDGKRIDTVRQFDRPIRQHRLVLSATNNNHAIVFVAFENCNELIMLKITRANNSAVSSIEDERNVIVNGSIRDLWPIVDSDHLSMMVLSDNADKPLICVDTVRMEMVENVIDKQIVESLRLAKDELPPLTKNVQFGNVENFRKSRQLKIDESTKKKKQKIC